MAAAAESRASLVSSSVTSRPRIKSWRSKTRVTAACDFIAKFLVLAVQVDE